MIRVLAPAVVAVMILSIVTAPRTDVLATNSVLYAWPSRGHSGDPIYLSGSGLPPRKRLTIAMACPNWGAPHVAEYGNIQLQMGPRTDISGEFTAFPLLPFELHVLTSSGCTIYTSDQDHPFGPDIPALYSIVPDDQTLPACSVHICAKAVARPTRVKAGGRETIHIIGGSQGAFARGARADVIISVPGAKAVKRTVYLDVRGEWTLHVPVIAGTGALSKATIRVKCRLGPFQGQARTAFLIQK